MELASFVIFIHQTALNAQMTLYALIVHYRIFWTIKINVGNAHNLQPDATYVTIIQHAKTVMKIMS